MEWDCSRLFTTKRSGSGTGTTCTTTSWSGEPFTSTGGISASTNNDGLFYKLKWKKREAKHSSHSERPEIGDRGKSSYSGSTEDSISKLPKFKNSTSLKKSPNSLLFFKLGESSTSAGDRRQFSTYRKICLNATLSITSGTRRRSPQWSVLGSHCLPLEYRVSSS